MAVIYPDYPDKDWDDDRVTYALALVARGQLSSAGAVAGAIRHPERRQRLSDHVQALEAAQGVDPRPLMVQVCVDRLGLDIPWPPPPAPVRVKVKAKAKTKRNAATDQDLNWR